MYGLIEIGNNSSKQDNILGKGWIFETYIALGRCRHEFRGPGVGLRHTPTFRSRDIIYYMQCHHREKPKKVR